MEIRAEEIQDYEQKDNIKKDRDEQPGEVIIEVEEGKLQREEDHSHYQSSILSNLLTDWEKHSTLCTSCDQAKWDIVNTSWDA